MTKFCTLAIGSVFLAFLMLEFIRRALPNLRNCLLLNPHATNDRPADYEGGGGVYPPQQHCNTATLLQEYLVWVERRGRRALGRQGLTGQGGCGDLRHAPDGTWSRTACIITGGKPQ
jgi:hypothetical protein